MSGFDPEAQSMLGFTPGGVSEKTTGDKVAAAICQLAVTGSIAIYGLVIDGKFAGNQNAQCVADMHWIRYFSIVALIITGLPLLAAPFDNQGMVTKFSTSLIGSCGLFSLVWSIYGAVVFFKDPVCPEQEIHIFGKVLACFMIVGGSLACCWCSVMVGAIVKSSN